MTPKWGSSSSACVAGSRAARYAGTELLLVQPPTLRFCSCVLEELHGGAIGGVAAFDIDQVGRRGLRLNFEPSLPDIHEHEMLAGSAGISRYLNFSAVGAEAAINF